MKLSEAIRMLENAGIDNARYEARLLFEEVGGISRSELYGSDCDSQREELITALQRRTSREPLQYIIGKCDFFKETYKVSPACLIPRQDTEILVEYAIRSIPAEKSFLDLCTGSGCIAISTVKNTKKTNAIAVDISADALAIAKENAEINGVFRRIEFLERDVMEKRVDGNFFAILSNPPYVTEKAYSELDEQIYHEPKAAFLGGEDGLDFYRRITELYRDSFEDGGFIAFEIGYDQGEALVKIAESHRMTCEIIKDYSGNDRVAVLKRR